MAEERPKVKSLKLKKESGGSELLQSVVSSRPSAEGKGTPDRKEAGNSVSKGKEVRTPGGTTKASVGSSSFGKNLVKVGKEFAKSNEKLVRWEGNFLAKPEQRVSEVKSPVKVSGNPTTKVGTPLKDLVKSPIKKVGGVSVKDVGKLAIKKEGRLLVKDDVKSPIKVPSKERKVLTKEKGNANGNEQGKNVNGKERGISVGKEIGKTNGKSSVVKDEGKNSYREMEKGKSPAAKSPAAKSPLAKSPVKPESASKSITKSGASQTGGQVRKQMMKTTTTTMMTTKIATEQKKEKKVFELPGQKHDPPEERDALRIFYTTLRDQVPDSDMAEVWLMEYGLLPPDEAQRAFERKQKRTQSSKQGGPSSSKVFTPARLSNGSLGVKKSTPVSNGKGSKAVGVSAVAKAKTKRPADSDSDSDDFLQHVVTKKKRMLQRI